MKIPARFLSVLLIAIVALSAVGTTGHVSAFQNETNSGPVPLNITFTDDGYEVAETVTAGWYFVNLDNQTDQDVVADIVLLPQGRTVEEFQKSFVTTTGGSTIPDWLDAVVFAGGPSALAEAQAQTLVELTPGNWTVLEVGRTDGKSSPLVVTEATGARPTPDMTAAVDVQFDAATIIMPEKVATGLQVWRIINLDVKVHSFAVIQLPQALTNDQMFEMLKTGKVPEGMDSAKAVVVGGIGLLSGGRTIQTNFTLTPGAYVIVDYVPHTDGKTNAEDGQFALFTIDAPSE